MNERRSSSVRSSRWIARSVLTLAGLFALASACADSPERGETGAASQALAGPTLKWSVTSASPFVDLAPRSDGSAIAATKESVLSIDASGAKTTLYAGPPPVGRPLVQRGAEGFLVPTGKGVSVHDATGTAKGAVSFGANEYARLIPGGLDTFVPRAESIDPEDVTIVEGRVFSQTGALAASFATSKLVKSRITKSHVLWATRSTLTKSSLAGATEWVNTSVQPHRFEIDDEGRAYIVNRSGDTRVVELYDKTTRLGAYTFDAPVWNIAIAPGGVYAAASSKSVAVVFKHGAVVGKVPLGGVYPVSLDVADDGRLLLGTQDRAKKTTGVALFDASGASLFSKPFGDDDDAYRPDVRFAPGGNGFFVRDRAGLSFYVTEAP
ncbi:MAG: hypothetical protein KF782_10285 [Labilithrix sp.]|nr:hypothetical protein [Labilithrix sp.]